MENKKSERKKFILFLVLLVIVIGVWSRTLSKRRSVPVTSPKAEEKVPPQDRKIPLGEVQNLQRERMAQAWGRNPFLAIGQEKEGAHLEGLTLSGILWDEENPLCVINGVVVGVNDNIDGYRIRKISSDAIVLEGEGETYTLRLGQ